MLEPEVQNWDSCAQGGARVKQKEVPASHEGHEWAHEWAEQPAGGVVHVHCTGKYITIITTVSIASAHPPN